MTRAEFVRRIVEIAKQQAKPVVQVNFEPDPQGLKLSFTFKETLR